MPNRILKESICSSDSIENLSWIEEVFFYRLIVNCDDYGRCDARPAILKARLFPLKDITTKTIVGCLNKLSSAGMVQLYEYDRKPYLQIIAWTAHQQVRNKRSRFPSPDGSSLLLNSIDINGNHSPANVPVIQSNPNPNPIQSENMHGASADASVPEEPPVIELPLNDKTGYGVTSAQVTEWSALYPSVGVMQELRNMKGWLNANPKKRKTRSGILRFINGWLSKEQDKGGVSGGGAETFRPSRT